METDKIINLSEAEAEIAQITADLENLINTYSNSSLSYTDCSNMSISTFLNQNVNMNSSISQFTAKQQNINCNYVGKQLIKNRNKTAKNKLFNKVSAIFRDFLQSLTAWNTYLSKQINEFRKFAAKFPKTSSFIVHKRSLTKEYNTNSSTFIRHKCQNDPCNLRTETAYMNFEFNSRLKMIFTKTFGSIYFTFFIGRICVPLNVNIRESEYFYYLVIAILNTFISYWLYYIPLSFLGKIC